MNSLFLGNVEVQVYRDWEHRFSKRVIRRSDKAGANLSESVQNLVSSLKRAF